MYAKKGDTEKALLSLDAAIKTNPAYKEKAKSDESFISIKDKEEFKKLTQ